MFSRTVSSRSRQSSCGTTPIRARISGPCTAGSMPSTRRVPAVAGEIAASIRIVEDLPAPFGPRKPNASPRPNSKSMPSTAQNGGVPFRAGYVFVRPRASTRSASDTIPPYRRRHVGSQQFDKSPQLLSVTSCGYSPNSAHDQVRRCILELTDTSLHRRHDRPCDRVRGDRGEIERLLKHPGAAVVGASADSVLISEAPRPRIAAPTRRGACEPLPADPAGAGGLATRCSEPTSTTPRPPGMWPRPAWGGWSRCADAGLLLPQAEGGLAAYLVALLNWHRRHRFCSVCGAGTRVAEAGLSRRCPTMQGEPTSRAPTRW